MSTFKKALKELLDDICKEAGTEIIREIKSKLAQEGIDYDIYQVFARSCAETRRTSYTHTKLRENLMAIWQLREDAAHYSRHTYSGAPTKALLERCNISPTEKENATYRDQLEEYLQEYKYEPEIKPELTYEEFLQKEKEYYGPFFAAASSSSLTIERESSSSSASSNNSTLNYDNKPK